MQDEARLCKMRHVEVTLQKVACFTMFYRKVSSLVYL